MHPEAGTWTAKDVEAWLIEAADTLRRLPPDRPKGFKSTMPEPVRAVVEAYGYTPVRLRPSPAAADAIDRLDEVLGWMAWLSSDQVRVVWARAMGIRWRPICHRLGCCRTVAWRSWVAALLLIAGRLNAPPATMVLTRGKQREQK